MTDVYDAPSQDGESATVEDPDELHRVRRVEAIHDARDRFVSVRLKARDKMDSNPGFHRQHLDRYAMLTALDYLRELEPMIRRSESDILERTVTIEGKRFRQDDVATDRTLGYDDTTMHTGAVETTTEQLLDSGGKLTVVTTVEGKNPETGVVKRRNERVQIEPDETDALRIVRLCDDFLEDVLPSLTDRSETVDFDYSDLL